MKKQILSILMTTSMIFTLSPATTLAKEETIKVKEEVTSKQLVGTKLTQWAEENVTLFSAEDTPAAKIGDKEYPTLQQAIDDAIKIDLNNGTITLQKDLDEFVSTPEDFALANLTIDLNGHTLTSTEDWRTIILHDGTSGEQLTIKNSVSGKGGITSSGAALIAISSTSSGTINLENIKISGEFISILLFNGDASGVMNIKDCNISGKSRNSSLISNLGFLNINGGIISTENNEALQNTAIANDGTLNVEGSTISSYDANSIYNDGTIISIKNSIILGPIGNGGGEQAGGNQVHGDATIITDIEIPSGETLDIPNDAKLTILKDVTLAIPKDATLNISDGATIINKGTIDNSFGGKIVGSENITSSDGGQVLEPKETIAPTINSITPSGKDVLTTGKIAITFNEEMDTTSIGTVKLNDTTTLDKNTGKWSDNTYTIDYANLASATDYTIKVSGFKDKTGNVMVEDKSHTFTTVTDIIDVTGVTLNKSSLSLNVGKEATLVANIQPATASNKEVTWKSSDPSVATVENGVVHAKKVGTTTITVTTTDGKKTASCSVKVVEEPILTHTIRATAETGGTISPSGSVTLEDKESKTFTILADENYHIESVIIDGVNKGALTSFTFENVSEDHTISATFLKDDEDASDYTYKVVSGGDATWDDIADLVFKIDGDFDTFKDIKLNDKLVDKADYTAERGSVILTLKPAYLKTLPAGKHRLNVLFEGNEVETSFTIKETPKTPDKETPTTPGKEEPTNKETPTTANKEEPVIKKSASQDTTSQNNIQNGCMIVLLACLVGVVAYRKKEN